MPHLDHVGESKLTVAIVTTAVVVSALFAVLVAFAPAEARGRGAGYVPVIIEQEQPNAWCYVLVNKNSVVGNIHMLDCIPKGTEERNPDRLSLEVQEK